MPLPGGSSDKIGNRYEDWWTVYCMINVMDEEADSIRLEPPEIEGFEFWLQKGSVCEYHQVKRQYGKSGRWTLSELESKAVLSNFWNRLQDPQAWCVFVSTQAAFQLDELADRARGANSWNEFDKEFLKTKNSQDSKTKNIRDAFDELCQRWSKCSRTEAYEALKRIRIETISEDTLRGFVRSRLKPLVDAEPDEVAPYLIQYAHDNIYQELSAHDIWTHVQRKYCRRQWNNDPHVLVLLEKQNERYLSQIQNEIILGEPFSREEVQTILNDLTSDNGKRGVMISGEAGIGKSSVILQVIRELQGKDSPVLAFRVDILTATSSPKGVGRQLELPESPACVLASLANGRKCVLAIDQLDAVSEASGRTPHFFECIHAIINEAQAHRNMRVLLACRKFDLDNDPRFRQLLDQKNAVSHVNIAHLPPDKVREVVNQLGLDAEQFNKKQLEVLSVPLHLKLLSGISLISKTDVLHFETVNDLYKEFWKHKQRSIENRIGRTVKWKEIIDHLCDYMSYNQVLFTPEEILDDFPQRDVDVMVDEHVLIQDDTKYSFFHENFFDYAFARRFFARGHKLMELLQSGEQHLFRRSQVRQILIYGRGRKSQSSQYLSDLQSLLTDHDVRFHIKQIVFALLRELSDPTEEEWEILFPIIIDDSLGLSQWAWHVVAGSVAWFQLLDEKLNLVKAWLAGQDEEWIENAFILLANVQKHVVTEKVAELVEPYLGVSKRWNERFIQLMQTADLSVDRKLFELFLRSIDDGILDNVRSHAQIPNSDFWSFLLSVYENHSDWTCEAIQHYLSRRLYLSRAADNTNPLENDFIPDSQNANQVIMESARRAPVDFITHILPFMLEVITSTAKYRYSSEILYDPVWHYRPYREYTRFPISSVRENLLFGMEIAMRSLASDCPEHFRRIADPLGKLSLETIHYLLIRAYTANGEKFADEAAEYLYSLPARLRTGYTFAEESGPYWATRELLEAITPHCSDESLKKLEDAILNFYPDWERKARGCQYRGFAQFVLLEGITTVRRSSEVVQRLEEWRRKFNRHTAKELTPEPFLLPEIPSPISQEEASKMNDEQWLKAIAKYNYEEFQVKDNHKLIGGAHKLYQVLKEEVRKDPERFASLVLNFSDKTNPYYFDAILGGMSETNIEPDTALHVCVRCHQLPNRPCGRFIGYLIAKCDDLSFSKEVVELVSWYATEDPEPDRDPWCQPWGTQDSKDSEYILTSGINSARGSAAEAMAKLIFFNGEYLPHFLPTLEKMIHDFSICVRACVAHTLIAVISIYLLCALLKRAWIYCLRSWFHADRVSALYVESS